MIWDEYLGTWPRLNGPYVAEFLQKDVYRYNICIRIHDLKMLDVSLRPRVGVSIKDHMDRLLPPPPPPPPPLSPRNPAPHSPGTSGPSKTLSLTRGAMKWLGSPVGLQASRTHLRLHKRATSSSAVEPAGSSSSGKKYERRFVSTLDPDRLRSEDLINLSGRVLPHVVLPYKEGPSGSSRDITRLWYHRLSKPVTRVPFPANTQGFLYFHQSPHSHPAAGEVRFRVVRPEDSSLPPREAFSRLTLDHRHNLWGVHLTVVLKKHPVIWRKLINDGIILPTRAAELESCVLKRIGQGRRWSRVLDSITDPFILGLGNPEPRMLVLHHGGIFQDVPGKALVRFEMANFPREPGASESIPKVVLRVLEITEPPKAEDAEIAS
ncbi:hypothetical protein FA13DRAFT_1860914 [Coprinellus micaceus]|uniref:Uncharacterized protein n=1 Tax=Coprinellus micaceus TaxID=71717 RepID=A0A4Y7T6Y2_COPMI|nr:hypothetical protein FA13DRAFT_1860914 [Coprinellus micaceus]